MEPFIRRPQVDEFISGKEREREKKHSQRERNDIGGPGQKISVVTVTAGCRCLTSVLSCV